MIPVMISAVREYEIEIWLDYGNGFVCVRVVEVSPDEFATMVEAIQNDSEEVDWFIGRHIYLEDTVA